jgi:hypothetical protein
LPFTDLGIAEKTHGPYDLDETLKHTLSLIYALGPTESRVLQVDANGNLLVSTAGATAVNGVFIESAGGAQVFVGTSGDGFNETGQQHLLVMTGLLLFSGANSDRARALGSAGDGLGVSQAIQPPSTPTRVNGAAGAAATQTYAAVGSQRHILTQLSVSFSAAPAAVVTLTVADGATTVFEADLAAATGLVNVTLPPGGIKGTAGNALVITVAAPGGAVIAKLSTAKLTSA